MPDPDEIRRLAAEAGARGFDALDHESVIDRQNAAGEAMALWALELLRVGSRPEDVAGMLGGAAATTALVVSAAWAIGDLR